MERLLDRWYVTWKKAPGGNKTSHPMYIAIMELTFCRGRIIRGSLKDTSCYEEGW